jgi:hypothetical protein
MLLYGIEILSMVSGVGIEVEADVWLLGTIFEVRSDGMD